MVVTTIGKKEGAKLFGFLITFFIFILFSNWFGLLPITTSLSFQPEVAHASEEEESHEIILVEEGHEEGAVEEEHSEEEFSFMACLKTQHCYITTGGVKEFHDAVHVLRAPTSDISMAIAFALVSVIATNYLGFSRLGKKYLKKYIDFSNPINAFVGLLEIVSEIGKLISFSFRLFGNVFAGEILLVIITAITFGIATFPFYILEVFVGVIQALVFFMLSSVFIGLALNHDEH